MLPGWQALFLGTFVLYGYCTGNFFVDLTEPWTLVSASVPLCGVLANLFLWLGLVFLPLGWRHVPWVASCLGLLCGVLWVIAAAAVEDWMLPRVFVGFWLWVASMACLVATGARREWQFPSGR